MDAKYGLADTWTADCRFRLTIDVRSVPERQKPNNSTKSIWINCINRAVTATDVRTRLKQEHFAAHCDYDYILN